MSKVKPTDDERRLAALAHAGILINAFNLVGMIATALIWATQRERSPYVRGHALQALVYQGAALIITIFLTLSWGLCVAASLLPMALRPELYRDGSLPTPFWLALSGLAVPLIFAIVAGAYGIAGAVQAYRGRPFFYPLAGRLALADLAPAPASPAAELPPEPPGDTMPNT